jgi:hypothetical protein
MAGTGPPGTRLERSLSLLGVSGDPPGNLEVQAGSPAAVKDSRSRSMSVNDVPSLEHGLDILINGSPIGDDTADGESLLDYNSDGNSETSARSQPADTLDIEMNEIARDQRDLDGTAPGTSKLQCTDALHLQCRASRLNSFRETLVSISTDNTFGKKIISNAPVFGTLDDHGGLEHTFHGARIMKGPQTVNQSVSASFEPSCLICITCKKEHKVIDNKPVTICFSDQNFVSTLAADNGQCVGIVRVENAYLKELLEIAREILSNSKIPEGSVLLFGSVSHLGRSGTTIYARDWTSVVALAFGIWRGVHIGPLVPLLISECSGSIIRDICEFSVWLNSVYENSACGFHETWVHLVEAMETTSKGSTTLDVMDSYKVALPSSLNVESPDVCITFCSHSSRPITTTGLSKDTCDELLSFLLEQVFVNFRACADPESYLGRVDQAQKNSMTSETHEQTVVLAGASNLKYSAKHFVCN